MRRAIVGLVILIVGLLVGRALLEAGDRDARPSASLVATSGEVDDAGFLRVTDPDGMTFPDAFGAHPEYQTEWWYYTGNLAAEDGRRFGYQFTIFRRGLVPGAPDRDSSLATTDVYMAHFALTDAAADRFYASERFERGGGVAAGAVATPYTVWLDDWEVRELAPGTYRMTADAGEFAIDFELEALKPPARHGINGLSPKSDQPGNASYYYSQSRLATAGTITVGDRAYAVEGLSWKDHEYGTSSLAEDAVGWDWFSLQLSDGRELMLFQIRTEDGGTDPASSGSLILEDGSVRPLGRDDFTIEVLDSWTSPRSGGEYPAGWRLVIPGEQIELTIEPLIADQELDVSTVYWEGAVHATGTAGGAPIEARGYIELTGYGGDRAPSI